MGKPPQLRFHGHCAFELRVPVAGGVFRALADPWCAAALRGRQQRPKLLALLIRPF